MGTYTECLMPFYEWLAKSDKNYLTYWLIMLGISLVVLRVSTDSIIKGDSFKRMRATTKAIRTAIPLSLMMVSFSLVALLVYFWGKVLGF